MHHKLSLMAIIAMLGATSALADDVTIFEPMGRFGEQQRVFVPVAPIKKAARKEVDLAWGEIWGEIRGGNSKTDMPGAPIGAFAIVTASIPGAPADIWAEVWGVEGVAPGADMMASEMGAIETASIPTGVVEIWAEIWGLGAPSGSSDRDMVSADLETASIPFVDDRAGWGEVWGMTPSTVSYEYDAIETASIPSAEPGQIWGEVWGLGASDELDAASIETASISIADKRAGWGEVWGLRD